MHLTLSKSLNISVSPNVCKYIICVFLCEAVYLCSQYSSMWLCVCAFAYMFVCAFGHFFVTYVCMNVDAFVISVQ